jgi:predicted  nucleic acid-binding Zn-ribbon protein
MVLEIIINMIAVILAGLATSIAWQMRRVLNKPKEKTNTIEDRIRILNYSLSQATNLISQIESEVKARSELAEKLEKDVEHYKKLVEIRKPEVEAIAQLLRGELKQESRKSFWLGAAVNFIFFVLGAVIPTCRTD